MDERETHEYLANLIRQWRQHRDMSQKDLADALGLHQSAVAKIETMERRVTYPLLLQLVTALDIPWDLVRPQDPSPKKQTLDALDDLVSATQVAYAASRQVSEARLITAKARQILENVSDGHYEAVQLAKEFEENLEVIATAFADTNVDITQIRLQNIHHEITETELQ